MEEYTKLLEDFSGEESQIKALLRYYVNEEEYDPNKLDIKEFISDRLMSKIRWDGEKCVPRDNIFKINESWQIRGEAEYGGEGMGDEYWRVFSVEKDGETQSYWKVPGWYQSYNGGELEYSEVFKVKPVQVTITKWENDK